MQSIEVRPSIAKRAPLCAHCGQPSGIGATFCCTGYEAVFGLLANDHAPAHRDSEPGKALAIAQSISFEPSRGDAAAANRHKRFFLASPDNASEVIVEAPIYWFNDMDWHGVHADPFFRYSVRVDGVFEPGFLDQIRRDRRR